MVFQLFFHQRFKEGSSTKVFMHTRRHYPIQDRVCECDVWWKKWCMRWLNDGWECSQRRELGGSHEGCTRDTFSPLVCWQREKFFLAQKKIAQWRDGTRAICVFFSRMPFFVFWSDWWWIDAAKWALIRLCNTCLMALTQGLRGLDVVKPYPLRATRFYIAV